MTKKTSDIIRQREDFIHGMYISSVEQKGDVLVLMVNFFQVKMVYPQ